MLIGFNLEGDKFSLEYAKKRLKLLNRVCDFLEVPVYRFIDEISLKIRSEPLRKFLDLTSSYNFKFTAHARDNLWFERDKLKEIELTIEVARLIGAKKVVFHPRFLDEVPPNLESDVRICVENPRTLNSLTVFKLVKSLGYGFVLDIPHHFLFFADHKLDIKEAYAVLKDFDPDHLHLSNTFLREEKTLEAVIYVLKGQPKKAFKKLIGDFHLPLWYGDIDYRKVLRNLKLPDTLLLEINSTNYELLGLKVERSYRKEVIYLKYLLAKLKKL